MMNALAQRSVAIASSDASTISVMLRMRSGSSAGAGSTASFSICSSCLSIAEGAGPSGCKRFAHRAELPARNRQQFVDAVEAHGPTLAFLRIVVLLERAYGPSGHQSIAMDAEELRAMPFFQLSQGRVEDVAARRRAHGDVLELGLVLQF